MIYILDLEKEGRAGLHLGRRHSPPPLNPRE